MLIVINNMLVPRDLPQVSTTTTDTNFKLYDSCMPYMGMQQKDYNFIGAGCSKLHGLALTLHGLKFNPLF
jgi:hypothetical protein